MIFPAFMVDTIWHFISSCFLNRTSSMVTQNPNFTITAITGTMYGSNDLHDNRLRSRNTSASYLKIKPGETARTPGVNYCPAYAGPVISTAHPRINWLFHGTLYFNYDASSRFGRNDGYFNRVEDYRSRRTSGASLEKCKWGLHKKAGRGKCV